MEQPNKADETCGFATLRLAYAEWKAGSPADAEVTFSQVLR
jgi:hypothetical protein